MTHSLNNLQRNGDMEKQNLQNKNICKLGFGLMRLPEKDGAIDKERLNSMVDAYMANGFNYFDTAYVYHSGTSESAFKEAVVKRYPRESFTIADKLPAWVLKSESDVQKVFDEQLERTGAGYFDFYLLHSVESGHLRNYDGFHCWEWAQEMKKKGLIRHFGFSFHDKPELLDKLLTEHPEVEFVQLQINYFDWDNETVNSRKCYEIARKHGKSIIVMEPVKGGLLASLREDLEKKMKAITPEKSIASWALRFAATLEGVMVVLSGMSTEDQMKDNIDTFKNLKPFTPEERACLEQVTKQMHSVATVGCTACRYCVDGCPKGIKIPDIIRQYNTVLTYGDNEVPHKDYNRITSDGHRAGTCVQCGQCENVCPQHLPIIEVLKKASEIFD
jgi:uncharacterized protein